MILWMRGMEQRMHSWKKQQIMQKAVRILKIRMQIEQKMYSRITAHTKS